MFSMSIGDYALLCHDRGLPANIREYSARARLVEVFDCDGDEGERVFLAVKRGFDWPFLVVTQNCRLPGMFDPSFLLVPETGVLFYGVGERLLAYELAGPSRLWESATDCGLWGWARCGECVIMAAELEMAAWDLRGRKLWSTFVEPPWDYRVEEGVVHLEVMGRSTAFDLVAGPPRPR